MVPAGTVVLQANAQALALEQGVLGPASPIPTQCLLLKNMFNPAECAPAPPVLMCGCGFKISMVQCFMHPMLRQVTHYYIFQHERHAYGV